MSIKNDIIENRYDIVLLFDIQDGNPNGDPDADNAPRMDPQTGHGLISDVCIKRKMRNFMEARHGGTPPYAIYVSEGAILSDKKRAAYAATGQTLATKVKHDVVEQVRQYMCDNYIDIRAFGGVMKLKVSAGTVRGPAQITCARSLSPIDPSLCSITRMAVETTEESESQDGNQTMGRKYTIPYGLYRAHMFITPGDAAKTGFGEQDLVEIKLALKMMFDTDRSAARGLMTMRAVYAFRHDNALGREQAGRLFDTIKVETNVKVPMKFSDYTVSLPTELPEGITLEKWV